MLIILEWTSFFYLREMFLQALLERDEQVRKAREEALQSNRDLEAQLAAESSANQDLQVSAVSCRNYKCMLSVHIMTFTNAVNINYQTNEVMERKIHHLKFISRIHVKSFFIYSLGKWIVFLEMIKVHSCNHKSNDYHLYRKNWKEREKGKRNWNNKCQNFRRKSNTPRKLMSMLIFFVPLRNNFAQPFPLHTQFSIPQRGENTLTKTTVCIICRVLNNKWREKSNLIGELEGQVRHMRTTWEDKERKLTQERDRAIDAAR